MSQKESQQYWTRWWGEMAYWGGITMGPSRTSMTFPSHGGAEGMLRRILGKWEIRWNIHEIRIIKMSHSMAVASNEIKSFQGIRPVNVDGRTTQRNTVYLCDVEYAIRGSMVLTKFADPTEDPIRKFEEMFMRRASMGQFHKRKPCLGTSECPAEYELMIPNQPIPPALDITEDYGLVYFDRDWGVASDPDDDPYYFAPMKAEKGVVLYPSWDEVRKLGISRTKKETQRAAS